MLKTIVGLSLVAALTLVTACQTGTAGKNNLDFTGMTVTQLQKALRKGRVSSVELVGTFIDRANEMRHLRAYTFLDERGALQTAQQLDDLRAQGKSKGPLHGIPIVVKDNTHVAYMPNSAGTPALKNFIPARDSDVVASLRAAGAIILGKTNMHELALGITSDNATFGAVANPSAADRFAGGSSGGSAAAVAAGLAAAALGTDTAGSIRIPAALTGISGFRPTIGRYSQRGVTPVSATRDTIGPMAKSVADLALLDAVMSGDGSRLKKANLRDLRLGVARAHFYENLDADTEQLVEAALAKLRAAGATLIEADIPDLAVMLANTSMPIALYEVARDLPAYLAENNAGVSYQQVVSSVENPDVIAVFADIAGNKKISSNAYATALAQREKLQAVYRTYFSEHDVDALVFPTTPLPAGPIQGSSEFVELNGAKVPTLATYIRNTDPAGMAGIPALSLPIGVTQDGLPVGLEIDGPEGSDRGLLAIGLAIESLLQ